MTIAFSTMLIFAAAIRASADYTTVEKGDAAAYACNYRDAIADYEQALQTAPFDGEVLVKLANAYEGAKWYGQSSQVWEQYLNYYPNGEHAALAKEHAAMNHRWLGSEEFLIGDPAEASINHLSRSIELDSSRPDAYAWLARVYNSEARFTDAVSVEIQAYGFGTPNAEGVALEDETVAGIHREGWARAAIDRGIQLYDEKHIASALSEFRAAGAMNPKAPFVQYWEGKLYMDENRFGDAAAKLEAFQSTNPHNYRVAWLLERAQQDAGIPLYQLAFYREPSSLNFPTTQVAAVSESRTSNMPGAVLVCQALR